MTEDLGAAATVLQHRDRGAAVPYFPILKGKAAEIDALQHVPAADRALMSPVIEAVRARQGKTTTSAYGDAVILCGRLMEQWGIDDRVLVDSSPLVEHPAEAAALLSGLHLEARDRGVRAAPVLRTTAGADELDAAADAIARSGHGAALRLTFSDLATVGIDGSIRALAEHLGLPMSRVDLIVDAGVVTAGNLDAYSTVLAALLPRLTVLGEMANVVVAGGAFPKNLDQFSAYEPGTVDRHDLALWTRLVDLIPNGLGFGDYAVSSPEAADSAPSSPAPNLRWAAADRWYVCKGKKQTRAGNADLRNVIDRLKQVDGLSDFLSVSFSWGDEQVDLFDHAHRGPGGAQQWRGWSISRHLAQTLRQVTRTGESSAAA